MKDEKDIYTINDFNLSSDYILFIKRKYDE